MDKSYPRPLLAGAYLQWLPEAVVQHKVVESPPDADLNPGFASDCKVRYYCNSDYPNGLCNNVGHPGSANVVTVRSRADESPGQGCASSTGMVRAAAQIPVNVTWFAAMTDAGAGTACVGGEAYLTQYDTTALNKNACSR